MFRWLRRTTWQALVAADRLLNALLGGSASDTLSARAAAAKADGKRWGKHLCCFLDWLDHNHCNDALKFRHPKRDA